MSIASVHPLELHSSHSSLSTLSHSQEDITSGNWSQQQQQHNSDHVLTIEELRLQMTSCFTCGVSWNDSHVSLDCKECGGYALEKPCVICDGACGAIWKRDLSLSHATGKASWQGECYQQKSLFNKDNAASTTVNTTTSKNISQDLSSKVEKTSANS